MQRCTKYFGRCGCLSKQHGKCPFDLFVFGSPSLAEGLKTGSVMSLICPTEYVPCQGKRWEVVGFVLGSKDCLLKTQQRPLKQEQETQLPPLEERPASLVCICYLHSALAPLCFAQTFWEALFNPSCVAGVLQVGCSSATHSVHLQSP